MKGYLDLNPKLSMQILGYGTIDDEKLIILAPKSLNGGHIPYET